VGRGRPDFFHDGHVTIRIARVFGVPLEKVFQYGAD
jgi:hypothetical protein